MDELRFQLPVVITSQSQTVNNGLMDAICVQGAPLWSIEQAANAENATAEEVEEFLWNEAGQTEACLLLDVYVPASSFNKGDAAKSELPSPCLPL